MSAERDRTLRVALTETCSVYGPMPGSVDDLHSLADRLGDIRDANIAHHVELVERAAGAGVQLLCMGELFAAPYFALTRGDPMWIALAEDAETGPCARAFCEAAKRHRMILVVPIYELDGRTGRRFNTAVVIAETGEILGKYRKSHIPAGTNEQGTFCETFYYQSSDGELGRWPGNISKNPFFPVFETSLCRLGVAICYDRHFTGVMQTLAEQGAELVVSPAITFGEKSRRMWDMEFVVDAARHNLFIGGSNRRGVEPPWNQDYFGASYFTGPNGRIAPVSDPALGDELVVADLPLHELAMPDPSGWNLRRDTRPEIYGPGPGRP